MKVRVTLTTSANFYHEGALKSCSTVVQLPHKSYDTKSSIEMLDEELHRFRQGSMSLSYYLQELWTRTLSCGSGHGEKSFNA